MDFGLPATGVASVQVHRWTVPGRVWFDRHGGATGTLHPSVLTGLPSLEVVNI
jgi:hypothetical protein